MLSWLTRSLRTPTAGSARTLHLAPLTGRRHAMSAATVASSNASSSGSASPHGGGGPDDDGRPSKRQRFHSSSASSSRATGHVAASVKAKLEYRGGMFLAPMVRIGTLTTRLLALEYGADLVWGPEIVDRAIIGAERCVDERSGVVEFQKTGPKPIWQTHPIEKSRLIYQIGTADPELALQAAMTVAPDVSGFDLNCGCPKSFSTSGGMGAALLSTPDLLCSILRKLVDNLPNHLISCKIRLLPSSEDTLSLVTQICQTGISCLTVHCRTRAMRSNEPALLHRLREVVERVDEVTQGRVPVVANGDCWGYEDLERIKAATGVTSVMAARGAEANVSCFRREGKLDVATEVLPLFVKVGLATAHNFGNAKYCINTMDMRPRAGRANVAVGDKQWRKSLKNQIAQTKSWEDMAPLVGIEDVKAAGRVDVGDLVPNVRRINERWRMELEGAKAGDGDEGAAKVGAEVLATQGASAPMAEAFA